MATGSQGRVHDWQAAPTRASSNAMAATQPAPAPNRARGLCLAVSGALLVGPDALLLRIARGLGGKLWTTVACKTSSAALLSLIVVFVQYRQDLRSLPSRVRSGGRYLLLPSLSQALLTLGFSLSLLTTSAATALMLIALVPMWAALFGWLVLGDRLPPPTRIALALAAVAVAVVFVPQIARPGDDDAGQAEATVAEGEDAGQPKRVPETVHGSLIALGTGMAIAAQITACRYGARKSPRTPFVLSASLGGVLAALVALPVAAAQPGGFGTPAPLFWPTLVLDSACITSCNVLTFILAPRHLTAPEVALALLLENMLGPGEDRVPLTAVDSVPSHSSRVAQCGSSSSLARCLRPSPSEVAPSCCPRSSATSAGGCAAPSRAPPRARPPAAPGQALKGYRYWHKMTPTLQTDAPSLACTLDGFASSHGEALARPPGHGEAPRNDRTRAQYWPLAGILYTIGHAKTRHAGCIAT